MWTLCAGICWRFWTGWSSGERADAEERNRVAIVCKSPAELESMYRAGQVVWQVLSSLTEMVRPGVSTMDLEVFAASRTKELGARPAFQGYLGFPCVLTLRSMKR